MTYDEKHLPEDLEDALALAGYRMAPVAGSAMSDVLERLATVPMAEYHKRYITASDVDMVRRHCISGWLRKRQKPGLELRTAILIGMAIHILAQGGIPWAPEGPIYVFMGTRRSKWWCPCVKAWTYAMSQGAPIEGMLTADDAMVACKAWSSLCGPDPPAAKVQAKNLLMCREQVTEGTYAWEPVEGLVCAVRPDVMVRRNGQVIAVPIKTTAHSLGLEKWWKMFEGGKARQGWLTSACFHHEGLKHANGEAVPQVWVTVQTTNGYPWSTTLVSSTDAGREYLWRGQSALEMMAEHWEGEVLPKLKEIRDWRNVGYGPEEAGIA